MKYQTFKACTACERYTEGGNALHHVKTRAAGGTDKDANLMPLCFKHHEEIHRKGLGPMSVMYHGVYQWLQDNGWMIDDFTGKWVRHEPEHLPIV